MTWYESLKPNIIFYQIEEHVLENSEQNQRHLSSFHKICQKSSNYRENTVSTRQFHLENPPAKQGIVIDYQVQQHWTDGQLDEVYGYYLKELDESDA